MKKNISLFLLVAIMLLALTGCVDDSSYSPVDGIASNSASFIADDASYYNSSKATTQSSYREDYDYETAEVVDEAQLIKDKAMVVRTASLSVDVANLDEFAANLTSRVETYGGYFEKSNVENYSSEYSTRRYGYFTVRVPQDRLDDFLTDIDTGSFVTSRNVTAEDVTLEYVDIEARIDAMKTQRETLMRLLAESSNITETLEIERRLTDVNYELDSYTRQQRALANKVSYSTVTINACEERNVDHPIRLAFEVNFRERFVDGIEAAADLCVGIIAAIPVIVIIVAFGIFGLWLLRKLWRKVFGCKGGCKGGRQKVKYMLVPMVQSIEQTDTDSTDASKTQKGKGKASGVTITQENESPVANDTTEQNEGETI